MIYVAYYINGVLTLVRFIQGNKTDIEEFKQKFCNVPFLGGGGEDKRAATELGFGHVTIKTWAYTGVFGFFRIFFVTKYVPSHPIQVLKIQLKIRFLERHFLKQDTLTKQKKLTTGII